MKVTKSLISGLDSVLEPGLQKKEVCNLQEICFYHTFTVHLDGLDIACAFPFILVYYTAGECDKIWNSGLEDIDCLLDHSSERRFR